jgi:hypothetical protein
MKKLILAGLILLTASLAMAQNNSKVDIFGGYSYLNQDTNGADGRLNLNGWTASATFNFHKYLGLTAEVGGDYGSPSLGSSSAYLGFSGVSANVHQHTFLFGPTVHVLRTKKLDLFGHALFGIADAKASASGVSTSDNGFAVALGGGADYNLTKHFGVRLVQADWLRTNLFGDNQNDFRYSGGLVFHF